MKRVGFGAAAGLVVGFVLARAFAPAPAQGQIAVSPAPTPAAIVARGPVECHATLAREDLEELKRALVVEAAAPRAATPPTPEPEPAYDDVAGATAVLDRARAAGEWRSEDADELRRLLPALSPDDRAATLATLMTALNSQQLRLATQRPI